jgi:hypothetical protein
MTNSYLDDFKGLLIKQEKEIPILEYRVKDLRSVVGVLLTVMDSGFISMILNVLNLWSQKHYNATIKITYQSIHDEQIEVTYNRLNRKNTEDILSQHQPKVGSKVNLQFADEDNNKKTNPNL